MIEAPSAPLPRSYIGPLIESEKRLTRYVAAAAVILVIGAIRLALTPIMGSEAPLLPFLIAVLAAASLGGFGPGLFATLITPVVVTAFFTSWPYGSHALAWSAHVVFFVGIGVLVTWILARLQHVARAQRTALTRAEASEAQLRLIANTVPALIAYVDTQHRYRFMNEGYERWFGAKPETSLGRHLREVIGDAVYEETRDQVDRALSGQPVHYEALLPYPSGARYVEAHLIPDFGPDNTVRGYVTFVEDISERKRAEQELSDARRSLSLALRAGRAGSFDWRFDDNQVEWSEELAALHGFQQGEHPGTYAAWLECVHPDDRARMNQVLGKALKDGHVTLNYRIRRRDSGEIRWIHGRGEVISDEQNRPVRMHGINADVTELKQAETTLHDRERMLNLIYDNASDCLYLARIEGEGQYRFISVNQTFVNVSGYSREQAEGRMMEDIVPASNHDLVRENFRAAIVSRIPVVYTEVAELPAGRRYGEVTLIPICEAGGPVTHVLGAIKDVTERRRAEAALVDADRRKDEFLAMLAHELRNPLAPIRNIAQILRTQHQDAATVRRSSELLQRQAAHLARLVDDLLDVARITHGSIELKKERVSIQSVLDVALETVQPLISLKHQTVNMAGATTGMCVHGDFTRLAQVFGNLLTNAAKYSPDRAIIEVSVEESEQDAVIHVRDEGTGIEPALIPRVFDLFMQADRSLDRSRGGLGVGLTIVKSLVEMHGGTVEAHSAGPGTGSEFIVRLPRVRANAATNVATPAQLSLSVSRRILVVDDNRDSAESLALLLATAGHETRTAFDGAAALQLLEHFKAEIVLLDIGLPGMDGYTVARTIRERFPGGAPRLYALTGYGREEDRARTRASGFDGHLTKPVDPERLLDLLGT